MTEQRESDSPKNRTRILLVDDSQLVQRMVREFFEPAGYEVTTACNGQEAMQIVRERPPHVIISDIIMPVMDGWEFCEAIRSDADTAEIPFLFLTAVREVPKRIQGLRMGADDYITKPFSCEELLARVEVCLAKMERLHRSQDLSGTALAGETSHMPVSDLLQLLSINGKSGELRITCPDRRVGRVFFQKGQVMDARLGDVNGRKALFRILDLPDGRFELEPDAKMPSRATIKEMTSKVLMEGFTHNDELKRIGEGLPERSALLRIGGDHHEHRESLAAHEKAVLPEFDDTASMAEVMDRSPLSDLEVGRAVAGLIERNLLQRDAG